VPDSVCRAVASGGAKEDAATGRRKRSRVFREHLPFSAVQAGIKSGHLLQGTLRVNRYNPFEGWVSQPASGQVWILSHWYWPCSRDRVKLHQTWSVHSGQIQGGNACATHHSSRA
jgi:hypothetical protein